MSQRNEREILEDLRRKTGQTVKTKSAPSQTGVKVALGGLDFRNEEWTDFE